MATLIVTFRTPNPSDTPPTFFRTVVVNVNNSDLRPEGLDQVLGKLVLLTPDQNLQIMLPINGGPPVPNGVTGGVDLTFNLPLGLQPPPTFDLVATVRIP